MLPGSSNCSNWIVGRSAGKAAELGPSGETRCLEFKRFTTWSTVEGQVRIKNDLGSERVQITFQLRMSKVGQVGIVLLRLSKVGQVGLVK